MSQNQQEGKVTVERGATRADIEKVVNIFNENKTVNFTLHSLSPNNVNDQNKKAINENHKNFNTLDQMHFQKIYNKISLVYSTLATVQQQISDPFFLKWVIGTAVSKCYGCNGAI